MNKLYRYIFIALVALAPFWSLAAKDVPADTVYFYDTWEDVFTMTPAGVVVDPVIEDYTPYQVEISTGLSELDERINKTHMAAAIGDSIWLVNSHYLKKNFKGDTKKLSNYIPLFFNEKMAFVTFVPFGFSWSYFLMGMDVKFDDNADFYYLDFMNRRVIKITPESLSVLLEDYHDLKMRYEGMKDYKKRYIIEDYFYKYIDRATDDIMRPYIIDLVDK